MTSIALLLYFAGVVNKLTVLCSLSMIFLGLIITVWWIIYGTEHERDKSVRKPSKKLYVFFVCLTLLICFIPSERSLNLLAGTEAASIVVQSEPAQKIINKVINAIDEHIK